MQLYIAYLLAEQYGSVHLNYEPYFWLTRSGPVSFAGLIHHLHSPQFSIDKKDFSTGHQNYLRNTTLGKKVVVTKYIRGNGRILPIEAITQPDHNIIVIRNVRSVLESLLYMDWDFSTVGYSYFPYSRFSFWRAIKEYLLTLGEVELEEYLGKYKSDPISRNAFYWYTMNRFAIENLPQNHLVVRYEDLSQLENWAKAAFNLDEKVPVNQRALFEGKKVHQQFPLEDVEPPHISRNGQRTNELIYYLSKGRGRFLQKFLKRQPIGNVVQKNNSSSPKPNSQNPSSSKLKATIAPDVLLDFLQKDIDRRIEEVTAATNALL